MKCTATKPVSNLDLKLLDVKFIAIDDNQLYLTEALHSVRKAKLTELPSLLESKSGYEGNAMSTGDNSILQGGKYMNRSILDSINQFDQSVLSHHKYRQTEFSCTDDGYLSSSGKSFFHKNNDPDTCQSQLQQIRQSIQSRNHIPHKPINPLSKQNQSSSIQHQQNTLSQQDETAQLQKYRRKIQLIKKENFMIHKQISSLYRNKISQNKEPLKKIRKIELLKEEEGEVSESGGKMFRNRENSAEGVGVGGIWQAQKLLKRSVFTKEISETPSMVSKKLASCPLIREKMKFYENLTEKSPYQEELDKIHKKIMSNNLHKNFEQYLVATSKRVPEFIKKLRN